MRKKAVEDSQHSRTKWRAKQDTVANAAKKSSADSQMSEDFDTVIEKKVSRYKEQKRRDYKLKPELKEKRQRLGISKITPQEKIDLDWDEALAEAERNLAAEPIYEKKSQPAEEETPKTDADLELSKNKTEEEIELTDEDIEKTEEENPYESVEISQEKEPEGEKEIELSEEDLKEMEEPETELETQPSLDDVKETAEEKKEKPTGQILELKNLKQHKQYIPENVIETLSEAPEEEQTAILRRSIQDTGRETAIVKPIQEKRSATGEYGAVGKLLDLSESEDLGGVEPFGGQFNPGESNFEKLKPRSENPHDNTMIDYLEASIASYPELLGPEAANYIESVNHYENVIKKNEPIAKKYKSDADKNAQEKAKAAETQIKAATIHIRRAKASLYKYIPIIIKNYNVSAEALNQFSDAYYNARVALFKKFKFAIENEGVINSVKRFFQERKLKKGLSKDELDEFENLKIAYRENFHLYDEKLRQHSKKYGKLEAELEAGHTFQVAARGLR